MTKRYNEAIQRKHKIITQVENELAIFGISFSQIENLIDEKLQF